jgi:hypothetical protein
MIDSPTPFPESVLLGKKRRVGGRKGARGVPVCRRRCLTRGWQCIYTGPPRGQTSLATFVKLFTQQIMGCRAAVETVQKTRKRGVSFKEMHGWGPLAFRWGERQTAWHLGSGAAESPATWILSPLPVPSAPDRPDPRPPRPLGSHLGPRPHPGPAPRGARRGFRFTCYGARAAALGGHRPGTPSPRHPGPAGRTRGTPAPPARPAFELAWVLSNCSRSASRL